MLWVIVTTVAVVLLGFYIAYLNRVFIRCPHCGVLGSWRFDQLEPPDDKFDEEGELVSSRQRKLCRKCSGHVVQSWSDPEGRTIEVDEDATTENQR